MEAVIDLDAVNAAFEGRRTAWARSGLTRRGLQELIIWRGGWADVNSFDGQVIFSEAPSSADVDSCLAVADDLVARLSGGQKRAGSV